MNAPAGPRDPHTNSSGLFWRAALAFLALPAIVAGLIPWLLLPDHSDFHPIAVPTLTAGAAGLLWCVRDFYIAGRGTLAPWSPPTRLVTVGLYRFSRNPMYIAVLLILCGWALAFHAPALWLYAGVVAAAFHLRVILYEEPWLARKHGPAWLAYRSRVSRWIGLRLAGATDNDLASND